MGCQGWGMAGCQPERAGRGGRNPAIRALFAVLAAITLCASTVFTAAFAFGATVLIVPPTGMPDPALVPNAMANAQRYYLKNTVCGTPGACPADEVTVISYPASFWPITFLPHWCETNCQKWDVSVQDGAGQLESGIQQALDSTEDEVVVFGHSQGSAVISNSLRYFATRLSAEDKARLQVVLTGNIDNPAGGLWSRLGFLGHIPILDLTTGLPTPTDTGIRFTSIIMQYDGVGNAPKYWGNLLSVANAVAGFVYLHGTTLAPDEYSAGCRLPNCGVPDYYPSVDDYLAAVYDPANAEQDSFGNTYVVVPSPTLPIAMPFLDLAARTNTMGLVAPIVRLVSPVLRVLIDLGYDPDEEPGTYSTLSILPFSLKTNPVRVLDDLTHAVVQGIHDALNGGPAATTKAEPRPSSSNAEIAAAEAVSLSDPAKNSNTSGSETNDDRPESSSTTDVAGAAGDDDTDAEEARTTNGKQPRSTRKAPRGTHDSTAISDADRDTSGDDADREARTDKQTERKSAANGRKSSAGAAA